jgi:hypothetical protein
MADLVVDSDAPEYVLPTTQIQWIKELLENNGHPLVALYIDVVDHKGRHTRYPVPPLWNAV